MIEHAELNRVQIGETLAEPGRARPEVAELQRLELVGGLGAELIVADQGLDRGEELLVLGHENLGVEDPRLLGARPLRARAGRDRADRRRRFRPLPEADSPPLYLVRPDRAVGNFGEVPADEQSRRARDAG